MDFHEAAEAQVREWMTELPAGRWNPFGPDFPHEPPSFAKFAAWRSLRDARRDPRLMIFLILSSLVTIWAMFTASPLQLLGCVGVTMGVAGLLLLMRFPDYARVWGAPWAKERWPVEPVEPEEATDQE